MSVCRSSAAQTAVVVAPETQAFLLSKVVSYDRSFVSRAIDRAKILAVARENDAESTRVVSAFANALASIPTVGGLPHIEEVVLYSSPSTIASTCNSHRISIVYLGPGLEAEIEGLRAALGALDVLSVAAVPDYVRRGVVLGFDLISGSVRFLLNRRQAREQNVRFGARLLRRMTIFE